MPVPAGAGDRVRRRAMALAGRGNTPFDAADQYGAHTADWHPYLWSPDGELNPYRDRIVARVRDLVRNDGWASGAVTRILDNAIGANFRPISKPDYRWLAAYTGNSAFDYVWAKEYSRAVDAHWRTWAEDPGRYCDAARVLTFSQMMRVGFRHELIDGDTLATLPWLPGRVGLGRARYCTAVQLIDPDRLSNPQNRFDMNTMRGGVEVDEWGAAAAYNIRKAHQGDWFSAGESVTWMRIPRETSFGRPLVVHHFVPDRAGQHRGGAGIFTPVVQRLKALIKYDGTELDAAIVNAIFAAYIESPMDPQLVKQAMGGSEFEDDELRLGPYQDERREYWKTENGLMLGGVRMPQLFPGEAIRTVTAARPSSNFDGFQGAVLRNIAAGTGLSAQQVSNDWSDVNYSSARAAMLEAWKTLSRRRNDFAAGFANPIRNAWLEEALEVDDIPMPRGIAPSFIECRAAYGRCRWQGPGRGWIDPKGEREGSILALDGMLSTLEDEVADNGGSDWEETLDQRKHELDKMDELGLPRPEWARPQPATSLAKPPEAD